MSLLSTSTSIMIITELFRMIKSLFKNFHFLSTRISHWFPFNFICCVHYCRHFLILWSYILKIDERYGETRPFTLINAWEDSFPCPVELFLWEVLSKNHAHWKGIELIFLTQSTLILGKIITGWTIHRKIFCSESNFSFYPNHLKYKNCFFF